MDIMQLQQQAKEVRRAIIRTIGSFGMGHLGGSLSAADIVTLLYFDAMRIDPKHPDKLGRDRLVLSKGHSGPVLYAALALRGYFPIDLLDTLNRPGTKLPSHCDMKLTTGIDMTAGSLGQGLSCAVGIAKAAKIMGGQETIYAIIGDGESQEGQIWEAAMVAAQYRLDNLVVILDYNKIQLDDIVANIVDIADPVAKWEAFGFRVHRCDGHDMHALSEAVLWAKADKTGIPSALILDTVKGKGVSFIEAMGAANHHCSLDEDMVRRALEELGRSA